MLQKKVIPAGPEWVEKDIREFSGPVFDRIGKGWMLITAANLKMDMKNWNTMTASWGGIGVLWRKNVAFIFVRPSRHTYGFVNTAPIFSLSFFDESCRQALNVCGEKSGRDTDKAAAAGLTPIFFQGGQISGAVSFKEAKDVIICKKIYSQDIDPALFLDKSIEEIYQGKDYHRMFVGEILSYRCK